MKTLLVLYAAFSTVFSALSFTIEEKQNTEIKNQPVIRLPRNPIIISNIPTEQYYNINVETTESQLTDSNKKDQYAPQVEERMSDIMPAMNLGDAYSVFKKQAYSSKERESASYSDRKLDADFETFGSGPINFDTYKQPAEAEEPASLEMEFMDDAFDGKFDKATPGLFGFAAADSPASFEDDLPVRIPYLDISGEERVPDASAERSNEDRVPDYVNSAEDLSA